jgi:hypothetical protein
MQSFPCPSLTLLVNKLFWEGIILYTCIASLVFPAYYIDIFFLKHRKKRSSGAAPSREQMMAVGCQRAFAAQTAVNWFERHLVADIFCEPHKNKNISPYYIDTLAAVWEN